MPRHRQNFDINFMLEVYQTQNTGICNFYKEKWKIYTLTLNDP